MQLKPCPHCQTDNLIAAKLCMECGYLFLPRETNTTTNHTEVVIEDIEKINSSIVSVAGRDVVIENVTIYSGQNPEITKRHLDAYLEWVVNDCASLKLAAIDPGAAQPGQKPLGLSGVYVDPDVEILPPVQYTEEDEVKFAHVTIPMQRFTVIEKLAEYPKMVILGVPGSGKSMLGRYLALSMAQAGLGDETALQRLGTHWVHGKLWPVRVVLRQFAESLPGDLRQGRAKHLWDFILAELENCGIDAEIGPILKEIAKKSGALFLLDGLDEAGNVNCRARVLEAVQEFMGTAGVNSRFLLTARPYAWEPPGEHLTELAQLPVYHLSHFNRKQIETFISHWYDALIAAGWMNPIEARQKSDKLQQAIWHSGLNILTGNPLLLTLTATLHSNRARLPEDRADLYHEVVELMLQRWNQISGSDQSLLAALDIPTLRLSDLRTAFEQLAFEVHYQHSGQQGTADISEYQVLAAFRPLMQNSLDKASLVVEYIERRAGLLVGLGLRQGVPQYTFPHRTFQEFLAACYLANKREYIEQSRQLARSNPKHWEQVIILAARRAGIERGVSAADALVYRQDATSDWARNYTISRRDIDLIFLAWAQLKEIGLAALEQRESYRVIRRRVFSWLLAILYHEDGEIRSKVAYNLGEIGDPAAVPPLLITLQKDDHPFVLLNAIDALGKIGVQEAVPGLLVTLHHQDNVVRTVAAEALGKIGTVGAVPGLLGALKSDSNNNVRVCAAYALGKIGDPSTVPALLDALQDAHVFVRLNAIDALEKIGVPAIPGLLSALQNNQGNYVRGWAAYALGQIGIPAMPSLLTALQDADSDVRYSASFALGQIGDPAAVPGLLVALQHDENSDVRADAAEALGKIRSPTAIPGLLLALQDVDSNVRFNAAESLGEIGDPVAIPGLVKLLSDSEENVWGRSVCDYAASALEKIGTPEALAAVAVWQESQAGKG